MGCSRLKHGCGRSFFFNAVQLGEKPPPMAAGLCREPAAPRQLLYLIASFGLRAAHERSLWLSSAEFVYLRHGYWGVLARSWPPLPALLRCGVPAGSVWGRWTEPPDWPRCAPCYARSSRDRASLSSRPSSPSRMLPISIPAALAG